MSGLQQHRCMQPCVMFAYYDFDLFIGIRFKSVKKNRESGLKSTNASLENSKVCGIDP